jgi:hypothetical protein
MRKLILLLGATAFTFDASAAYALCANGDPDGCCAPPAPAPIGACNAGTRFEHLLSVAPAPDTSRFAITSIHAVWSDVEAANRWIYQARYAFACNAAPPAPIKRLSSTNGTETLDASTRIGTGESLVYYDRGGGITNLEARRISIDLAHPTLPAPPSDRRAPATAEGPAQTKFIWEHAGDIYACLQETCTAAQIIQVTSGASIERNPRISKSGRAVWQNASTGRIIYANLTVLPIIAVDIDAGAFPDINDEWIVYSKLDPQPGGCTTWSSHYQIYAYGPFSGAPIAKRISAQPNWGVANFIYPRLTDNYVVYAANWMFSTKTAWYVSAISSFATQTAERRELTDAANSYGTNLDAYEDPGADKLFVIGRDLLTPKARFSCCESSY